jgi:7,8-dihydropterin-6-yl-methyl-4-(beta-D-ribofuranosyl)aminobenzene 5'-phosphate synthase
MSRTLTVIALTLTAIISMAASAACSRSVEREKGQTMDQKSESALIPGVNDLTIKVVYDNNPHADGLGTAWGFACVIIGADKTILFDTGGNGALLLDNMKKLAIEPNSIDVVVLSHIHGDHTGGLASFLDRNPKTEVYVPTSFPKKFKENVRTYGAKVVEVAEPLMICKGVYSSGQLGTFIKEQSLVIQTKKGLIVVTGCAHPGIVNIVNAAQHLIKNDILLVMGGFHLEWATKGKIEKIISAFKQLHVQYVGPCHCTGNKARSLFQKHFGKHYINIGVGRVITMPDLQ